MLTLSQERCPWREMLHQKGWPSSEYPNGPFCIPCRAISAHDGDSRVYGRYAILEVYLYKKIKSKMSQNVIRKCKMASAGHV